MNLFSRKFDEYSYLWDASSDWVIYKQIHIYNYLFLDSTNVKVKDYGLWEKVDPKLRGKSLGQIKKYIENITVAWYRVRTIPDAEVNFFEDVCTKYGCRWKIEAETVIDFDIANIETAESIECPDEIYDELVQYAIKKGVNVINVDN